MPDVVLAELGALQKGMASDVVQKQFRARGIEPIPVPAGRRAMIAELSSTEARPVIVLGEGPWKGLTNVTSRFGPKFPLLARTTRRDGAELSVDRVIVSRTSLPRRPSTRRPPVWP